MFWIAILLCFGAIGLLAWIGGALVNRGLNTRPPDDTPFIPGLRPPNDDDIHHHGH
jgi:hypothetical protein